MMYGSSTGWLPIQVRINRSDTSSQKPHWLIGRNAILRCFEVCREGIINKIKIDMNNAKTPPNLLGIDGRIAYANRKYHSGLMCGGVFKELAGV